ncbi:chromate efflux transporter [Rhodothermus marinus]|uniref:Chromate transporter, chromate ion transporter (CHR) family n=1 Tax=Rhodothermus marinus (strain ATCC 43812 / DSM 4252 / R-10) TaxID=518766 RepID=D0MF88_RHOM4|nr:chromate efflux transporter [Rhodothermus marinus]ACY49344.1 chromate transporter, chromate ion transporter (CHR) family [Rhodothermus marinus DSM 4252]
MSTSPSGALREVAGLFLKLGLIAFGGPAAHIAMMEEECVVRRRWVSRQHFLDLVGATNLIPGPNSTEMAMHLGYERAGWRGLVVAGVCFILPAALITGLLGWLYVRFGNVPEMAPLLQGIKPAVLAIILGAVWRIGRQAVRGVRLAVIGLAVAGATGAGLNEVLALLGGGVLGMFWLRIAPTPERSAAGSGGLALWPSLKDSLGVALGTGGAGAAAGVSLGKLFLFFLKVGAVLYGSGYVLVAFLEGGLVQDYGWLTQAQLLDAVAIGQFTPGPVLTTATFIGYVIAGWPGAVAATAGIFLPSFLFVGVLNPLIPKLRASRWLSAFLDAVNVSAVALMAVVIVELGRATLLSWPAWAIALTAAVATLRFRVNAAWLVLGGALAGWLLALWA